MREDNLACSPEGHREEDCLEDDKQKLLNEPSIHIGDTIRFCSIGRGAYLALDDESGGVTWHNDGESSLFTIYPAVGQSCNSERDDHQSIRDGSIVCLFAPNGYFLSDDGDRLAANRPYYVAGPSAEFFVHVAGGGVLRNGGKVFLQNCASCRFLDAEDHELLHDATDSLSSSDDAHHFQVACFAIEKVSDKHVQIDRTPRKRRASLSSPSKYRSRVLVPKLFNKARRGFQQCAYLCKPEHKKFMIRSAMAPAAIAVA